MAKGRGLTLMEQASKDKAELQRLIAKAITMAMADKAKATAEYKAIVRKLAQINITLADLRHKQRVHGKPGSRG
jgi:hypothetical protein